MYRVDMRFILICKFLLWFDGMILDRGIKEENIYQKHGCHFRRKENKKKNLALFEQEN